MYILGRLVSAIPPSSGYGILLRQYVRGIIEIERLDEPKAGSRNGHYRQKEDRRVNISHFFPIEYLGNPQRSYEDGYRIHYHAVSDIDLKLLHNNPEIKRHEKTGEREQYISVFPPGFPSRF